MKRWKSGMAGLAAACALLETVANAGPPFLTDDPEPVALGHYEFYTFTLGSGAKTGTFAFLPAFEANYGVIPNGQVHIIAPLAIGITASGPDNYGYGDTELGFKYRFIDEEKEGSRPQVGVYPLLEQPTGNESHGLGAGHLRAFLPVWIQKSFGDWTTYGGGGYWFNQDNQLGDKDYWFFGWLLQRKVTDKLTIGGEIFHQTSPNIAVPDMTGFNIGAIYDFDEHNHLLASAGRGLQNANETNQFSWYLGYQLTW